MRRWAAAARVARADDKCGQALARRDVFYDMEGGHRIAPMPALALSPRLGAEPRSVRQRIRTNLEVHGERLAPLAAFAQPRGAVAAGAPQSAALPAGIGIVDAAVESFGVPTHRIGHAQ